MRAHLRQINAVSIEIAEKYKSTHGEKAMNILDMIAEAQGGQGLDTLARKYRLESSQTRAALEQLGPAVMAGIRLETDTPDGISDLIKALAGDNHARYLDGDDDGIAEDGDAILGHIFGSKEVSRGVAARASETTGVDVGTLKQMLPAVAAMVMGALSKNALSGNHAEGGGGGLGDILGQVLGGGGSSAPPARFDASGQRGGLGDILGQFFAVRAYPGRRRGVTSSPTCWEAFSAARRDRSSVNRPPRAWAMPLATCSDGARRRASLQTSFSTPSAIAGRSTASPRSRSSDRAHLALYCTRAGGLN